MDLARKGAENAHPLPRLVTRCPATVAGSFSKAIPARKETHADLARYPVPSRRDL